MLLFYVQLFSQEIVPLASVQEIYSYQKDNNLLNEYIYIKDVNNILTEYLGKWNAVYNGKEYHFEFLKNTTGIKTSTGSGRTYKEDQLLMRFQIKEISSGNILIDNFSSPLEKIPFGFDYLNKRLVNGQEVYGDYYYKLFYGGSNANCGDAGYIFISINNLSQMVFSFLPIQAVILEDCPGGSAFSIHDDFTLEKE